jgi:hypothetical protein
VRVGDFIATNGCEFVYHISEKGSWSSIQRLGLLSTSALLDACGKSGPERSAIETKLRPSKVLIAHPVTGTIIIRDQDPLRDRPDKGLILSQKLEVGTTPEHWFAFLNSKVFFWVSHYNFRTMLAANLYQHKPHWVIKVNTKSLLEKYATSASVSDQNSGSLHSGRIRGPSTFVPFASSPVHAGVKELAIDRAVPDIQGHTVTVTECIGFWKNGEPVCETVRQVWPELG